MNISSHEPAIASFVQVYATLIENILISSNFRLPAVTSSMQMTTFVLTFVMEQLTQWIDMMKINLIMTLQHYRVSNTHVSKELNIATFKNTD